MSNARAKPAGGVDTPMFDHDQRFKVLIREFFAEFIRLFFPHWAERFDYARIEWLEQEQFVDPPKGAKRFLDLVAKLPVSHPPTPKHDAGENWLVLVHIEIEYEDNVGPLRERMCDYYHQLRKRHGLPILPIALYLRVSLQGVGWDVYEESFWGQPLVRFQYAYIGLPALEGEHYLHGANVLGIALGALMRLPEERKEELAWQALQRALKCQENDYRRFLLQECVLAYLPLNESQEQAYVSLLRGEKQKEGQFMATSYLDQLSQRSLQQGVLSGQRELIAMQLEERFGELPEPIKEKIRTLPAARVMELGRLFWKAQSLDDLGLSDLP